MNIVLSQNRHLYFKYTIHTISSNNYIPPSVAINDGFLFNQFRLFGAQHGN